MQQKENFLSTQKGKIIAGSGGLVGIVVIYLLLSWMFGFWPFGKLTKEKINAMVIDPGAVTSSISQTDAAKKAKTVTDSYNNLKNAADKLNVNNKDEVLTALNALKTKTDEITTNSKSDSWDVAAFVTSFNQITKADFESAANAIIKAADLK
uniref:Immunodominant membrane protein n=1 Tax=Lactuca serriola phytoplasma TaxID=198292 RepID=A0A7L8YR95_9MOLU|nr:immunodominant membrane protein [Lactuca serriola phytoplasma]